MRGVRHYVNSADFRSASSDNLEDGCNDVGSIRLLLRDGARVGPVKFDAGVGWQGVIEEFKLEMMQGRSHKMIETRYIDVCFRINAFSYTYVLDGVDGTQPREVMRSEMLHKYGPREFVETGAGIPFLFITDSYRSDKSGIPPYPFEFARGGVPGNGLLETLSSHVSLAKS